MLAATLLASEKVQVTELPIEPLAYGGITLVALLALLGVTYAFRSAGNRH